ncbi:MAG: tol-pal system YbgF family protein [Flavobacteriaceae bacterium]
MDEPELASFEKELEGNTDLQTKVAEVRSIIQGVEAAVLRERLDVFHEELHEEPEEATEPSPVRRFDFRRYAIAASVAILIGITGFWYISRQEPHELLFQKHFSPDPGLPTTMSTSANFEFYEAMVSYKRGDYGAAIAKWETLLSTKPNNDTLNYFLGVAHLANSNTNKALEYLKTASAIPQSSFANETLYYLGMANLSTGDIEAAKRYLNQSKIEKSQEVISEMED